MTTAKSPAKKNASIPLDLDLMVPWFPIIRRMMQLSSDAPNVIKIIIVAKSPGEPLRWIVETKRLEPRGADGDGFEDLLRALGESMKGNT